MKAILERWWHLGCATIIQLTYGQAGERLGGVAMFMKSSYHLG